MTATTYTVQGMTCGHCVATVKTAVGSVTGVSGVEVDLQAGTVTVTGTSTDPAVTEAISKAGYEVVSTKPELPADRNLLLAGKTGGCCCG